MPSYTNLPEALPVDLDNDLLAIDQLVNGGPSRVTGRVTPRNLLKIPEVKTNNKFSYRINDGPFHNDLAVGRTAATLFQVDSAPGYIRFRYENSANTTYQIDGAAVAFSASANDGYTPLDANGNDITATAFIAVTFNGNGADLPPFSTPTGNVRTLVVPANTNASVGSSVVAYSDWIEVIPVARVDGGQGCFVMTRTFAATTALQTMFTPNGPLAADLNRAHITVNVAGNSTVSPYNQGSGLASYNRMTPCGIDYISSSKGIVLMAIGSSIIRSDNTTAACNGFGQQVAALLNSESLPISYFNFGLSGISGAVINPEAVSLVPLIRPQVALVQTYNNNDGSNGFNASMLNFSQALESANEVDKNGGAAILIGPSPWPAADSPTIEAARLANNARLLDAAGKGFPILDLNALWGVPGTDPVIYKPGYDSGDGRHPSDLACQVAAQALGPIIKQILGLQ